MNVTLALIKQDGSRRDFPLTKSRITLGRTEECGMRVPLAGVSRQHCEITISGDSASVRDLGSSNGTFHNNKRIQEAELQAGDLLSLGGVTFMVVIDGQPEGVPAIASPRAQSQEDAAMEVLSQPQGQDRSATVDMDDPINALEALADAGGGEEGEGFIDLGLDEDNDKDAKKNKKK
jgi:pSer/pThr/pTyr-binding forkhead associated (FHA) protein